PCHPQGAAGRQEGAVSETFGRLGEERVRGDRERADRPGPVVLEIHGRRPARAVESELRLRLDHRDSVGLRQLVRDRDPGDPAADDHHVEIGHSTGTVRRAISSVPAVTGCVPNMAPWSPATREERKISATWASARSTNRAACVAMARRSVMRLAWASASSGRSTSRHVSSRYRSSWLSLPRLPSSSRRSASSAFGSLVITRSTSRAITFPDPSQMALSGDSRKIRGRIDSSTYPAPPRHSIASLTTGVHRLVTQYFAAGVRMRLTN